MCVRIDGHLADFFTGFHQVNWVDDGVSFVFFPLLERLAVFDPVLQSFPLPFVFGEFMLLKLVLFQFVFEYSLFEFVRVWDFVVDGGFDVGTRFVMQVVEQMMDVFVRVRVELQFVVPGLNQMYFMIFTSYLRLVTTMGLTAPECKVC